MPFMLVFPAMERRLNMDTSAMKAIKPRKAAIARKTTRAVAVW
jgi:hypothetical protein